MIELFYRVYTHCIDNSSKSVVKYHIAENDKKTPDTHKKKLFALFSFSFSLLLPPNYQAQKPKAQRKEKVAVR